MATIKISQTDYEADYVIVQDHQLIVKFDNKYHDEQEQGFNPHQAIDSVFVGDTDLSSYNTLWLYNYNDLSLVLSNDGSVFEPTDHGEPIEEMETAIDPEWEAKIAEQERYREMIENNQVSIDALRNSMQSYIFDGLKVEANPDAPVTLNLPMDVIANVFYKSGDSVFVAMKNGTATELNHDWFEWWSGPNPFEE